MAVQTKTVAGRRNLRFQSLDELQTEVRRLAAGDVKMIGNWSLGQMLHHLAAGLNSTMDGSTFKPPWFFKVLAPLMKKKFVYGAIPAGFQIPQPAEAQFLPRDDIETAAGLDELEAALARFKAAESFAPHPLFGRLSKEENEQFQLRHAEMHLSFAVPVE